MRILVIDPSGNHGAKEGFGTTGFAIFNESDLVDFNRISSEGSPSDLDYWAAIVKYIVGVNNHLELDAIVCESYNLLGSKALVQSGSSLDTPQLIGIIRMHCYRYGIPFIFQSPKDKVRVADPQLVHLGVLTQTEGGRYHALGRQTVIHERDAIRHGVFFNRYNKNNINRQAGV